MTTYTVRREVELTLTSRQVAFIARMGEQDGTAHYRDWWYVAAGRGNARVMKTLIDRGFVKDVPPASGATWVLTDKGRLALRAAAAPEPPTTKERP